MGGRRASKIIESSVDEANGVRLEQPENPQAPDRPPRGAKDRASQAWRPLVPTPKSAKADKESAPKPKPRPRPKKKDGSHSDGENYAAPDIDLNSDYEGPPHAMDLKKTGQKAHHEDKLGSESESSSSDSDGDKSSGEEDDAEKTEASDLEELEKRPGALKAQFDAESVNWVDNDDHDHHEVPPRSPSPSPVRNNRHAPLTSPTFAAHEEDVRLRKRRAKEVVTSDTDGDSPRHQTSKKLKSSAGRIPGEGSNTKPDHDKKKPHSKSRGSDKPDAGNKARTGGHRDDKENARKAHGGLDKGHGGRKGVVSAAHAHTSANARREEMPSKAGSKRKVREDIEWARPSDDETQPPLKTKRSEHKHRKCRRGDGSDDGNSSSSDSGSDSDTATDSDDSDDDGIDLVLRKRGGRLKLKKQRPRVRRVAKAAIEDMLLNVCTVNAYPDGPDKSNDFAQSSLIRSAKAIDDLDIARRLKRDEKYWKKLGSIPLQRIPNFRGKVKKMTDALVKRTYGLKPGDALKVIWLQEGLRYIFPFDYEKKTIVDTEPYSTPIFVEALQDTFFAKPWSYGYHIASHFGSSLAEAPHEKEIPAAMLALVATAIYASIDDYRNVRFEAGDFKSNVFIDIYRLNIATLSDFKNDQPGIYHNFMHQLFKDVCTWTGAGVAPTQVKSFLNTKAMVERSARDANDA